MTTPSLASVRLGFIGLGLMGLPMCRRLRDAGAALAVTSRDPAKAEAFAREARGAAAKPSPRAVADAADIVILMLSDTPAVEAVLLGLGEDGLVGGLTPRHLVIDMGTTAVAATRRFAAAVAAKGAAHVDAPVSGGVTGAETGTLSIMAGGSAAAIDRARPVLGVLGTRLTHVGEAGAGQVAKAANQMIVGLTIAAVAEALALAAKAGVDRGRVREALMGGFAASRILELHGQRMIERAFAPGGKATTQRKDVAQALELARDLGLELPSTALNLELWDRMIARGLGDLDHSALYELYA
jgi:3-hydroxyisobutyrate dehydrogenase-like beta-hydroxyacid dehydrogenase